MRALDVGCGWEDELWFPGADLCDGVFAELVEPVDTGGRVVYPQYIESKSPRLPIENETYDLIWCGSMWGFMSSETKQILEEECYRLLKPGGRLFICETLYIEAGTPEWDLDEKQLVMAELDFFLKERWHGLLYFDKDVEVDGAGKCVYFTLHLKKKEDELK